MSTTLPIDVLLRLIDATPAQRALVDQYVTATQVRLNQPPPAIAPAPRYLFLPAGSHCEVIFDGLPVFHLPNQLGAKYLGHFLHHANAPIAALDMEQLVQPEKAKARTQNTAQGMLDVQAVREYLRQIEVLRALRARAAEEGHLAQVAELDADIQTIEATLQHAGRASDAGERARVNVNKAVTAVLRILRHGEAAEQAFLRHLNQFLSLGYECCYHQPPGITWEGGLTGKKKSTKMKL